MYLVKLEELKEAKDILENPKEFERREFEALAKVIRFFPFEPLDFINFTKNYFKMGKENRRLYAFYHVAIRLVQVARAIGVEGNLPNEKVIQEYRNGLRWIDEEEDLFRYE